MSKKLAIISIVIPVYNNLKYTKDCIASLSKYTDSKNVEVIVVANGCTDGTEKWLKTCFWDKKTVVKSIVSSKPLGFAGAVNLGLQRAKGNYIVILNNDTVLLEQPKNQWLDMLLAPFKDSAMGITGPILQTTGPAERPFIIFFCAMIKRKCLDDVGLLDTIFGVGGGEDTDFCVKAQEKGWKIAQAPYDEPTALGKDFIVGKFPIWHKGEATVENNPKWLEIFKTNSEILRQRYGVKPKPRVMVNLGCGDMLYPKPWINVDLYNPKADMKMDVRKLTFVDNYVDEMYSSHVIEHFDFHEGVAVLKEWHRALKPGGKLSIECPDLMLSCKKFISCSEDERINNLYPHFFGMPWLPGGAHLFMYTEQQLRWVLDKTGFKNIVREPALRYIGKEDICLRLSAIK